MESFKKLLDKGLAYSVYFLTVLLLVVTSAQVFWRYVFNNPIIWAEEFARINFVWLTFLTGCIAFQQGKHMAVDLLPPYLSAKNRRIQTGIVNIIMGAFLLLVLFVTPELMQITWDQPSATLNIPYALIYGAFPASAGIMLAYLILDLFIDKKGGTKPL